MSTYALKGMTSYLKLSATESVNIAESVQALQKSM